MRDSSPVPLRCLIVDDNPDFLRAATRSARGPGHRDRRRRLVECRGRRAGAGAAPRRRPRRRQARRRERLRPGRAARRTGDPDLHVRRARLRRPDRREPGARLPLEDPPVRRARSRSSSLARLQERDHGEDAAVIVRGLGQRQLVRGCCARASRSCPRSPIDAGRCRRSRAPPPSARAPPARVSSAAASGSSRRRAETSSWTSAGSITDPPATIRAIVARNSSMSVIRLLSR